MKVKLWDRYRITLRTTGRIYGGVPRDPEIIKKWIASQMPDLDEAARTALADKTVGELGAATAEKAESMWTTFKRNGEGIYIESRQLKAAFKEEANVLRELLLRESKAPGPEGKADKRFQNLKSKVAERVFVEGYDVHLTRDGKPLAAEDGFEERPIHVITRLGPRTALKRIDYAERVEVCFTVKILRDRVVDEELLRTMLEYGSCNGIGADRSQGGGQYEVVEVALVE